MPQTQSPIGRKPAWVPEPSWTGTWTLPDALTGAVDDDGRNALLAAAIAGLGPKTIAKRLALSADASELLELVPSLRDIRCSHAAMVDDGVRLVLPCDDEYPEMLRNTSAPPPLLFVRGARLDELQPAVSIVGSRGCTSSGRSNAARVAAACAAHGLVVVSGLARGIDGAAHAGAVQTGRSVAVLGTGIDRIYPPEHARLAARILEDGAIVSEFAPGADPRPWHFPARNRIIAGLSMATVVVEAGVRSGALITAGMAGDEGRGVYACLVAPDNVAGAGVRQMLRDGVDLVVDPDDLAADLLGFGLAARLCPPAGSAAPPGRDDDDARVIWGAVLVDTSVEEIVTATQIAVGRVRATLAQLELDGYLRQVGHDRWSRRE